MLETAILEYLDHKRYFSSLNLAAVAEELYGKYLRVCRLRNSQEELIDAANEMAKAQGVTDLSVKEWKKISTLSKNSIKHFDSEADRFVEMDPEDEARLTIANALTNHTKLDRQVTPIVQRFVDFGKEWATDSANQYR